MEVEHPDLCNFNLSVSQIYSWWCIIKKTNMLSLLIKFCLLLKLKQLYKMISHHYIHSGRCVKLICAVNVTKSLISTGYQRNTSNNYLIKLQEKSSNSEVNQESQLSTNFLCSFVFTLINFLFVFQSLCKKENKNPER